MHITETKFQLSATQNVHFCMRKEIHCYHIKVILAKTLEGT